MAGLEKVTTSLKFYKIHNLGEWKTRPDWLNGKDAIKRSTEELKQ